jgi:hypothetical protein
MNFRSNELQIFETKVCRKILGPKKGEMRNLGYYLHIAKRSDLYRSFDILNLVKSGRHKWAAKIASRGKRNSFRNSIV